MASNAFPSMTALLGLVALAGYQNRDKIGEWINGSSNTGQGRQQANLNQKPANTNLQSGINGVLGNLSGTATSASSLLSNGLRELMDRFKQNGHGETAQSWINQGPNAPIAPHEIKTAIGTDVLTQLSQQTGLPEEELLARLSRELPTAVDKYTPDGRVPA